jgi:hypothetical protein
VQRASESARGCATRRPSFAVACRCNFNLGRVFCLPSRRTARYWAESSAFYKWRDAGIVPLICPTCQNISSGSLEASLPATQCYFAWGCFRYFSWEGWLQSVFALASLKLRRTRDTLRSPRGCATRSPKGEAWWACLDSNQEPDRYERPALTIELQAPPQAAAFAGRQRCRHRLQG